MKKKSEQKISKKKSLSEKTLSVLVKDFSIVKKISDNQRLKIVKREMKNFQENFWEENLLFEKIFHFILRIYDVTFY